MLPNKLQIIKMSAFNECNSLKSVTIPATVEFIYQEAFANCNALESVKALPDKGWGNIPTTMPAQDVTVAGSFTINKYRLVYMVDGEEYKSYGIEYGTYITPETEPNKEGHSFSGWNEIPETMPANDVTITGTFTINKYKITYIIDGEVYLTEDVEYGSWITPPNPGDHEGYDFAWDDYPDSMPAHDITINGIYTATGIEAILASEPDVKIFTVSGKSLNKVQKGVNILRYKDGRTRKIVVK